MSELVARLRRMQSLTIIGGSLAGEAADEIESLRQQLAAALGACKVKNLAIEEAMGWNWIDENEEIPEEVVEMLAQALAAQTNDSALKAWMGKPKEQLK